MDHLKKVTTLPKAISRFVKDGSHISFGGFTVSRQPMACAYEIIRQGVKNLHVYIHSGGQALDVLIGAGCVKAVEIAYGANGRFAPTCIRFRKAVEGGELMVEDYTNYQMTLRFKAGAMGVPYLPVKSGMGTDIVQKWGFDSGLRRKNPRLPDQKLLIQNNPFNVDHTEPLVLLPAVNPDVTILHVQQADYRGTVRISGLVFADVEQAMASQHVIVTCEELLEPKDLQVHPECNHIPFFVVDAVIHLPFGAHPSACYGYYDYDSQHLRLYKQMAEDDKKFPAYLDKYIYSVNSHQNYLKKIGKRSLNRIRAISPYGYALGLKRK